MSAKGDKDFRLRTETVNQAKEELKPWILDQIDLKLTKLPKVTWKDVIATVEWKDLRWVIIAGAVLIFIYWNTGCRLTSILDKANTVDSTLNRLIIKIESKTDSVNHTPYNKDSVSNHNP